MAKKKSDQPRRVWLISEALFRALGKFQRSADQLLAGGLEYSPAQLSALLTDPGVRLVCCDDRILVYGHLLDLREMADLEHNELLECGIQSLDAAGISQIVVFPTPRQSRFTDLVRDYRAWVLTT